MLRKVAWAFGAQLIRLVTAFVLVALLAPSERGFQALFVLIPTLLASVSMLGLPSAVPVFLHRPAAPDRLFRTMWTLALLISALMTVVMLLALPWLTAYLNYGSEQRYQVTTGLVALGPLLFVPTLLGELLRGWVVARQRMAVYVTSQLVAAGTQLSLVALLVVGLGLGAWGAIWATIVSAWLSLAMLGWAVRHDGAARPLLDATIIRPLLRLGLVAHAGNVVQLLNYQLDMLLLKPLLAAGALAAVGYYSTAVALTGLIWNVPNAVALVLLPQVAAGQTAQTPLAARQTVLLASAGGVGLALAAWPLFTLLRPSYAPVLPALLALLPGVVSLSLSKVLASDLGGRGQPRFAAQASAVTLLLTVVGDVTLIPRWGFWAPRWSQASPIRWRA